MSQSITPEDVVRILNEVVDLDPNAIDCLLEFRVPCNEALADHATVQVSRTKNGRRVGFLGLLNGLFQQEEKGHGPISAVVDPSPYDKAVVRQIRRFDLSKNRPKNTASVEAEPDPRPDTELGETVKGL